MTDSFELPDGLARLIKAPSDLAGEWVHQQQCNFWSHDGAVAIKHAIEKMTGVLLKREDGAAVDPAAHLVFRGSSQATGNPVTVRLALEAVIQTRMLYRLEVTDTAPRKWVTEQQFLKEAKRKFDYWCSKLELAHAPVAWAHASPALLAQAMHAFAAEQAIAALATDDFTAIAVLQTEVCTALRNGMRLGTASHEGGTRIYFDGHGFVCDAFGEQAKPLKTFDSDAAMLQCVRALFAGDAGQNSYPHPPAELEIWRHILGSLLHKR